MTVYVRLVEAAANGGSDAEWGLKGYYFCSSQEASQYDIAVAAGKVLKKLGVVQDEQPKQRSVEEVAGMLGQYGVKDIALYMYAANSRTRADRAEKVLGYKPQAPSIWESLEGDLRACYEDKKVR